jgi:hypothetical protein
MLGGGFAQVRTKTPILTSEKQDFSHVSSLDYPNSMETRAEVIPTHNASELTRLSHETRAFLAAAKAPSTRRAYRADWDHFEAWCCRSSPARCAPCSRRFRKTCRESATGRCCSALYGHAVMGFAGGFCGARRPTRKGREGRILRARP